MKRRKRSNAFHLEDFECLFENKAKKRFSCSFQNIQNARKQSDNLEGVFIENFDYN